MRKQTIAVLGAMALALGLAGSAGAASSVDITYDLSSTTFLSTQPPCPDFSAFGGCSAAELLGGSMKISYTSNSASSMPILHGPATLQSLALRAQLNISGLGITPEGTGRAAITTAYANISLVSPAVGSLLSGGTLALKSAQLRVTGSRHCRAGLYTYGLCIAIGGTLTSILGPLGPYTTTAALSFAASAGPYGGAQSTRHTVSGLVPLYAPTEFVGGIYYLSIHFATGANIVGREVLREAEGHDPKVTPIPEPGTLVLLGAGAAGLTLVGRATRRSQR